MKPSAALYPFASHHLDLGKGVRMHYLDEGRGSPVVMLHGNPSWSFMYRELVKALSPAHRCVVPDHVGMGLSDKPDDRRYNYTLDRRVWDFDRLLEHLGIRDPITLVVHDWGGMIGMAWAVRHPERIERLVVMNTAAFFPPLGKPLPWQLRLARTGLGEVLIRGFNAFASGAARACCVRRPMAPEIRAAYTAPYDSWAHRIATHRFVQDIPLHPKDQAYATVAVTEQCLERLKGIPMLLVWGGKDFVFDQDYLREWRRRFPGAELVSIPDAGHYVLEDAPDIVIPAIEGFVPTPHHA